MWEWLAKEPLLKIADVTILLGALILLSVIVYNIFRLFKRIGKPSIKVNKDGVQVELDSQENSILDLLKQKDDEILELRKSLEELTTKFKVLEAEISRTRIISEYNRDHLIPLTNHSVFFNLTKNFSGGISLECKGDSESIKNKVIVAKTFLEQCKLPIFHDRLKEFVDGFNNLSDGEAIIRLNTILDNIYKWIDEYSEKAEKVLVEFPDGRTIRGIPRTFIDKFNEWHDPHVKIVVYKIKDVLYSAFYNSWQLKLIVILDHIDTAFYLTIKDIETTIDSINGAVDKEIKEKLIH